MTSRMALKSGLAAALSGLLMLALVGCAGEPTAQEKVVAPFGPFNGKRIPIAVGEFVNRTAAAPKDAAPGTDRLSLQARGLLLAQMAESQRFAVTERTPKPDALPEVKLTGREFKLRAAEYEITGDIVEVGTRIAGEDKTLGVFGSGKKNMAYAAVTLYIVNTQITDAVYGARGFSEEETPAAGPDAAQSTKLLELAIREALKDVLEAKERMRWGQELK